MVAGEVERSRGGIVDLSAIEEEVLASADEDATVGQRPRLRRLRELNSSCPVGAKYYPGQES